MPAALGLALALLMVPACSGTTSTATTARLAREPSPATPSDTAGANGESGVTSSSGETPASDSYLGALHFAWPEGCSVPVSEEVNKTGQTATLSYRLEISDHPQGRLISYRDLQVVTLNGATPSPALARSAQATFGLPSFLVKDSGMALEVIGVMAERDAITKYWNSWVGLWLAVEPIDALRRDYFMSDDYMTSAPNGGEAGTEPFAVESLIPERGGEARLRMTHVLEGAAFARSINASTGADAEGLSGQATTTVEIAAEPTTLKARRVTFAHDATVSRDGSTRTTTENRQWSFAWEKLTCAG